MVPPNSAATRRRPAAMAAAAMRRIGDLVAPGWQVKLYGAGNQPEGLRSAGIAAALRAAGIAAARRTFGAIIAAPAERQTAGFALLRALAGPHELSVYWWEAAVLHRTALVLPGNGLPPCRAAGAGTGRLGDTREPGLIGREREAWLRHTRPRRPPSVAAYLAESCP